MINELTVLEPSANFVSLYLNHFHFTRASYSKMRIVELDDAFEMCKVDSIRIL
jgi:hypothetical protein